MKILVLHGSPKEKSDTRLLVDAFLEGMSRTGKHEVELVRVIEKRIAPCRGCFGCWDNGDGHCVIDDDQNGILDLYRDADVIIWSFPLYCYGMPAPLKAVLDRTIPMLSLKMVEELDGTVRHETVVDFSKKHTLILCGFGFPAFEGNCAGLRAMCRVAFCGPDVVCVPETPLLHVKDAASVAEKKIARFKEAGEEYARTLTLSEETVRELEAPMIPRELYLKRVNG